MIFYTADPHFGYEPALVWRPQFASVEEMDEALIAAWNAVVSDDDTVYLIGGSSIISLYAMLGLVSGVHARPDTQSHERYIHPPRNAIYY